MTSEEMIAAADAMESGDIEKSEVIRVLSELEGCRVTIDEDLDARFYRWGDEFFAIPLYQIPDLLRAAAAKVAA